MTNRNQALFLDRDGVINEDYGYVCDEKRFELKLETVTFLQKLPKEILIFIITNQSGISRGYYSLEKYLNFQFYVENLLKSYLVEIEKTYFCPYHPNFTCDGRYDYSKFERKPHPGMIMRAAAEYNIDLSRSTLIGDNLTDMEAGRRAGVKNLFLLSEKECQPKKWYKHIKSISQVEVNA